MENVWSSLQLLSSVPAVATENSFIICNCKLLKQTGPHVSVKAAPIRMMLLDLNFA